MRFDLRVLGIPLIGVSASKDGEGETINLDSVKKMGAAIKKGINKGAAKVAAKTQETGAAVRQGVHDTATKVASSTEPSVHIEG